MTNSTQIRRAQWGRREFLTVAGASIAALASPPFLGRFASVDARPISLTKFVEQLPIPPKLTKTGGGTVNLVMSPGLHQFHTDLPAAPTWGYGGAGYLGPTIEVRRGIPITLNATNSLGSHPLDFAIDTTLHGAVELDRTFPRASLHLHGGNTSPENDGGPVDTFTPGAARSYFYNNDQEAASIWYHDHALGITRLNVYAGLAGFYWIRDERDTGLPDNPLGLPTGMYEIPLVIQDKMFNPDGSLAYPPGEYGSIWAPEFFGDVAVINGKAFPNLNVSRGLYRFRIVNGSNARVYNLKLSGGETVFQIGTDGGLLNAPVPLTRLTLAPGERADVLVDFSRHRPGSSLILTNDAPTPFPDGPRSEKRGGMPLKQLMQFTVGSEFGFEGPIPSILRSTPIVPLTDPVRIRNVSLVEIVDEETDVPQMALLNNLEWMSDQIEMPVVDTVEQWNIINTTGDTHPIHLHLVQFQLLGRQKFDAEAYVENEYPELDDDVRGPHPAPSAEDYVRGAMKPPSPNEAGWKDTIRANPGEITRILVPFGANAAPGVPFGNSYTGDYVWHCHILEHEDNEMMLPYSVVSQ
jgi:spore coat protein A, manganese oxidase